MNLEYKYLLDGSFDPDSRIWIYQSSRIFTISEALEIEEKVNSFAANWKSHGTPVKGAGYLFFGQFIILMADETAHGVSGCSTDGSVRFIKEIEQEFKVNLFDRTMLTFVIKDKIQHLPLAQLGYAFQNGFLDAESLYFNNTVQTKRELEEKWIVPVKESWLAKKIPAVS
jgi:hypothetical protein